MIGKIGSRASPCKLGRPLHVGAMAPGLSTKAVHGDSQYCMQQRACLHFPCCAPVLLCPSLWQQATLAPPLSLQTQPVPAELKLAGVGTCEESATGHGGVGEALVASVAGGCCTEWGQVWAPF